MHSIALLQSLQHLLRQATPTLAVSTAPRPNNTTIQGLSTALL
jgi:hypothetical protein